MRLVVCVKQVPDTETKLKLNSEAKALDEAGIKWIVSPFDEFAIEEVLRLKEKLGASETVVLSVGPERTQDALRSALAMGVDRAIRISGPQEADSFWVASALSAAIQKLGDVAGVYFGKEAIDDGASIVPAFVAENLGAGFVSVCLSAEWKDGVIHCRREVEGGALEIVEAKPPVVITAQKGLNEPRYPSLQNVMKSKKKEIEVFTEADLGLKDLKPQVEWKKMELPEPKSPGRILTGSLSDQAAEVVRIATQEWKVLS